MVDDIDAFAAEQQHRHREFAVKHLAFGGLRRGIQVGNCRVEELDRTVAILLVFARTCLEFACGKSQRGAVQR